jgi:hypothetical protein
MPKILPITIVLIAALISAIVLIYFFQETRVISNVLINNLKCGKPRCDINCDYTMPVIMPPKDNIDLYITSAASAAFHQTLINFEACVIKSALEGNPFPTNFPGFKTQLQFNLKGDKNFGVAGTLTMDPSVMIVAFRGTQNVEDLLNDTRFAQKPFGSSSIMCHEGFVWMFNSLAEKVNNFIKAEKVSRVIFTGHSLGAAVALLFGASKCLDTTDSRRLQDNLNVAVITYACPRVGNFEFMEYVNKNVFTIRFRNDADAVPNFPAAVSPNEHNPNSPFMYYHCGVEYIFQSNWLSVLNNHMIPVYMDYVSKLA